LRFKKMRVKSLDNNISNRSKYIEKLIREDFERRGKNIEREF